MRRLSGRLLNVKRWVIIMIFTLKQMLPCWQMFSRTSRNLCQGQYGLDPAHYYTSPGLSWDALLKKTGVELELFTDLEMYLFVERGMRGGFSMVSNRYAKASNPLLQDYDPSRPNEYIMYLDANNLYGWAMSKPSRKELLNGNVLCPLRKTSLRKKKTQRMDGFLRWILNTQKNCMKNTTAFPLLPRKSRLKMNGCRNTKTV